MIKIKINQEKCVGCFKCIPYCPLSAIKKNLDETKQTAIISQEECVECGVCLRSDVCMTDALYWPELSWPRSIRQAFSAVLIGYDTFEKAGIYGYAGTETKGGRGTAEMKTNDVTGRYRDGEVGIAVEFGRPSQSFYFRDLEKLTRAMASLGVEFEKENPLSVLLDSDTGKIKYREILEERAMSAIVEIKISEDRTLELIDEIKKVSKEVDTVLTINIINKCKDATIPVLPMLEKAGVKIRINGKTNVGLGRPLIK